MRNSKKRNYPKTRKKRDTSYSEMHRITEKYSLSTIRELWKEKGMYRTAYQLGTSPYVIRYMAQKYGGKRPAGRAHIILKGVLAGSRKPEYYKTLDFNNIKPKEK